MPPASKSRRSNMIRDDSDDEQDAPPRRASTSRRGQQQGTGGAGHDDDDSEGEIDPSKVDLGDVLPQYLNQPLHAQQSEARLKLLVQDLKGLRNQLITTVELLEEVGANVASEKGHEREADLGDDEVPEDPEEIRGIEKQYRHLLDKLAEIDIRTKTLSEMRQKLAQRHVFTNLYDQYEQEVQMLLEAYGLQTPRQKYLDNQLWKSFRALLWAPSSENLMVSTFDTRSQEQLYDGKPVPNLKRFIPSREGRGRRRLGRRDRNWRPIIRLQVPAHFDLVDRSGHVVSTRCTSSRFSSPVLMLLKLGPRFSFRDFSNKCPHSYSRAAFVEFVAKGKQNCPVHGCPVKDMTMEHVHEDLGLKRRVEAHKRRVEQERQNGGASMGNGGNGAGTQRGRAATQWETVESSDEE
ncbi:BZ3500_MvSof-1268-A1-R1_Chr3-1g06086 [Microbotryum saponariae]|uniref:BZ3500_MvSof-1268-A1-R1_Chr3-1g06086 protein n=1 Tax=Microbotryum saponariae TaxID=289078 RepID=A0A2X0N4D5_9BASI|nr:BZ3500_MvSof-1268-A1-R1_Chr3-1g06086 [Microbotryum saponariae]SDA03938.1 BZ3501_MvSof-1269-A2-R1_Chr3-2g05771 [Microbotryum saponariae]